jgi:hypothetical protein
MTGASSSWTLLAGCRSGRMCRRRAAVGGCTGLAPKKVAGAFRSRVASVRARRYRRGKLIGRGDAFEAVSCRRRSRPCLLDLLHPVLSRSVIVVAIDGLAVHSLLGDRVTDLNQRSIRRETPAGPSSEAIDGSILNAVSGAAPSCPDTARGRMFKRQENWPERRR